MKNIGLKQFGRTEIHKLEENEDKEKGHIKHIAPIGILIGIVILLSLSISVVSACETYVLVNPSESIQAAIDSICPEGGIVELAAGTWYITDTILIINKSNVTFRGNGSENSKIYMTTANVAIGVSSSSENITFEDFYLNGGGSHNLTAKGISTGADNTLIQRVEIEDCESGVQTWKCYNFTIRDSEVHHCQHCITIGHTWYTLISNCTLYSAWMFGINYNPGGTPGIGQRYNTVENCEIHSNGNEGIHLYSATRDNTVRNNVIRGNVRYGIGLYLGGDSLIENNTFYGNGNGIRIFEPASSYGRYTYNNTLRNNIVRSSTSHGVYVHTLYYWDDRTYAQIISNTIYGNGEDGIRISNAKSIIVKNNIVVQNSGYGIYTASDVTLSNISYNDAFGNNLGNYYGQQDVGNLEADPLFADPVTYDFHLKSEGGRWNPITHSWVYDSVTSLCIDAGDPSSDYSNEPSPNGGRINICAYGNTAEASKSPGGPIDIFPPTTTYFITPGVVTFFRSDIGGSGISYTNYSKTSEMGPWTTVNTASAMGPDAGNVTGISEGGFNVTVVGEGITTIWYYSVDKSSNVETVKNVTVKIDTTPPVIYSNVTVSDITGSSATIVWTTDELANSLVKYGTSPGIYTKTKSDSSYVTSHSITLTGLTADTTYYYVVNSTDQAGNSAQSSEYNFTTLTAPEEGEVILWDTNKKYTWKDPFSDALADKANWTQVPYGMTNYTWAGDPMIENEHYYLFLFSNTDDCPDLRTKFSGGRVGTKNEIYKVYDTGTRDFGQGALWTNILKNTPEEVIVESAGEGDKTGLNVTTIYRIPKRPWLEVEPVERVNQQGMHDKSRLAAFIFENVSDDIILDADKHGDFIERINPPEGCIGEINFQRRLSSDEDCILFLTFPPGVETNSLTYQTFDSPDCYWEWDCRCCIPRSVSQNFAYLEEKVVIGVLNFEDNWKREDVGQYLNAGETYTSSFTAPYAGKWRVVGVMSDDDHYITNYSSEVIVNVGDHFTFTSPVSGTLDYLVMYMFDRTENTPENITTIMDVYRETIGIASDTTPPAPVNDLSTSNITPNSITLAWTAPGDDENTGIASKYDIRYSISPITESNWDSATQCTGEPSPQLAGSTETFTVTGLSPNTTYYFALKTADEVPNWSEISNSPSGTTSEITYHYIWLEAENADSLTPDFEIVNDPSASNGKYIQIPEGVGFRASDGEATYNISIDSSDNYVIWGRKIAVTDGDNSFFVQIDDGTEYIWTIALSDNWQWDAVNHWGSGEEFNPEIDPVVFNLSAGNHILKIEQREDGTKLDRLLITNNMSYVPADIEDTTPPASISNLQNFAGTTWINWTWTNPSDDDFNYTMVYLNGTWQTNTSDAYYNATELSPDRSYEIETHTVDTYGNVNSTWVNQTAKTEVALDTTLPVITIQSPENKTYTTKLIPLNFTADEPLDTCILSVDSTTNQTLPNCQNLSVISREYEAREGTAAWWHFNGDATDISGNNNHGTVNGASFVDGKFGSALKFDGINDWVSVSDSDSFDTINKTITIEAWVKPILTGNRNAIIYKYRYSGVNERCFGFEITEGGNVSFVLCENGTYASCQWFESLGMVENNTWNHVAGTSDGTTMRIYINGQEDPNTYPAPPEIYTNDYSASIGIWQYGESSFDYPFNGEIDELRILNRCLSAEEIKSDYALGEGSHSVTVYGNDTAGNWNPSIVYFSISTVTNLGSISGTITYTCNETGIAGVTVNLTNLAVNVIASATTDSDGNYTFTDISPGDYNVTASKIRFWSNSTSVAVNAGASTIANLMLWLKGDLNNDGISADASDLAMMSDASVGKITTDWKYDLNNNGMFADAGDLAMMRDASVGKIEVLYKQ